MSSVASKEQPAPAPSGLASAISSVAGLTLASRVLGFGRWIVQALAVGSGTVAGAYSTANQVPNVLYEIVVGGALAGAVIPLLAGAVTAGRKQEVEEVISTLLTIVLTLLVPLSLLLIVLANPVAALFPTSQGVEPELQQRLVADFLRMLALQIPMYGIGVLLTGLLQAHNRFTWPALTPVFSSLLVIATYFVYGQLANGTDGADTPVLALQVLGWGTTAGVAALSLPLLWPVRQLGIRIRPSWKMDTVTARRALRLGGAGIWTLIAQQISVVVVLVLARSHGTTGTVAVYQYMLALYMLPYAVLVVPVATVLYPRLSAAAQLRRQNPRRFPELVATSTAVVAAIALAGGAALAAGSAGAQTVFSLLTPVNGLGYGLALMSFGLLGFALVFHLTRVLYAADLTHSAVVAVGSGWLSVSAFSIICVQLYAHYGGDGPATLEGLGLGSSLGMTVAGVALLLQVRKQIEPAALAPTLRVLAVGLPVAILSGVGGRFLTEQLKEPALIIFVAVLVAVLAAALVLGALRLSQPQLFASLRAARRADNALTESTQPQSDSTQPDSSQSDSTREDA